jgi:hypothetical protein
MTLFQEAVSARGHASVASAAGKLADRVANPAAYERSTAYRASMRKGGSRDVGTLYQTEAAEDLAAMGKGKTTAAQDRMADSFGVKRGTSRRGTTTRSSGRGLVRKRSKRW